MTKQQRKDGIHDLAVKSAEATTEQVERTGEILNLAVTDPQSFMTKPLTNLSVVL